MTTNHSNNSDKSSEQEIDEALKTADFSDRVWMFFFKYSRMLIYIGLVALVMFILAVLAAVGQTVLHKYMQSAYLQALETDNKEYFAQKYASDPLGGTIFLEWGDKAYQQNDYKKASDYYRRSVSSLGKNILGGRAAIGEGVSLIKLGSRQKGEAILAEIAEEKSYPLFIRGQAMYFLASSIYEQQDTGRAKKVLNQLINSNFSTSWKTAAKSLLQDIEMQNIALAQ
ncbi:MAG: hypothetical protein LBS71_01320 [Puniceicoccales bacterium]|jgi:hypothetical protein|nr:hypothetical protein [Puniceicoccales bacterium]